MQKQDDVITINKIQDEDEFGDNEFKNNGIIIGEKLCYYTNWILMNSNKWNFHAMIIILQCILIVSSLLTIITTLIGFLTIILIDKLLHYIDIDTTYIHNKFSNKTIGDNSTVFFNIGIIPMIFIIIIILYIISCIYQYIRNKMNRDEYICIN
jgi:hypothetical protein